MPPQDYSSLPHPGPGDLGRAEIQARCLANAGARMDAIEDRVYAARGAYDQWQRARDEARKVGLNLLPDWTQFGGPGNQEAALRETRDLMQRIERKLDAGCTVTRR